MDTSVSSKLMYTTLAIAVVFMLIVYALTAHGQEISGASTGADKQCQEYKSEGKTEQEIKGMPCEDFYASGKVAVVGRCISSTTCQTDSYYDEQGTRRQDTLMEGFPTGYSPIPPNDTGWPPNPQTDTLPPSFAQPKSSELENSPSELGGSMQAVFSGSETFSNEVDVRLTLEATKMPNLLEADLAPNDAYQSAFYENSLHLNPYLSKEIAALEAGSNDTTFFDETNPEPQQASLNLNPSAAELGTPPSQEALMDLSNKLQRYGIDPAISGDLARSSYGQALSFTQELEAGTRESVRAAGQALGLDQNTISEALRRAESQANSFSGFGGDDQGSSGTQPPAAPQLQPQSTEPSMWERLWQKVNPSNWFNSSVAPETGNSLAEPTAASQDVRTAMPDSPTSAETPLCDEVNDPLGTCVETAASNNIKNDPKLKQQFIDAIYQGNFDAVRTLGKKLGYSDDIIERTIETRSIVNPPAKLNEPPLWYQNRPEQPTPQLRQSPSNMWDYISSLGGTISNFFSRIL